MTTFISFIILLSIVSPITCLIHELGHAIPAMIFTDKSVKVYIGYRGEPNQGFAIFIGRLEIRVRYNPILWGEGSCFFDGNVTTTQNIIITLMGPLFSLFFGITIAFFLINSEAHGSIKLLSSLLLISAILDFYYNIKPHPFPILLYSGEAIYNDGYQIRELLKLNKLPKEYEVGVALIREEKYDKAINIFQRLIDSDISHENLYIFLIHCYSIQNDNKKAVSIYNRYEKEYSLKATDYYDKGFLEASFKDYEACVKSYSKAIDLNPYFALAYNNRGYNYTLMEAYEKAIADLSTAIEMGESTQHAYPYNNRGYAKIMLGKFEEGVSDIKQSISIDANNSYAYRNLGIYYYEVGQYQNALDNLKLAYDLDRETPLLDNYMAMAEEKIDEK